MPFPEQIEGRSSIRVDVILWDGTDARVDRADCWESPADRPWSTCTFELSGVTGAPEPEGALAFGLVLLAALVRRRRWGAAHAR